MAKLVYSAITSLDGYIEDAQGEFAWSAPGEEVHAFINDLERGAGTYLYGRRLYEVMRVWETLEDDDPVTRDYAELWRAADKVLYSTTLESASTSRTRLERGFDAEAVRELKAHAERDLSIGGAELAAHAFASRLIDECRLFLSPVVVGGGKRALPEGMRINLGLLEQRRFGNGVVYLRYRVA